MFQRNKQTTRGGKTERQTFWKLKEQMKIRQKCQKQMPRFRLNKTKPFKYIHMYMYLHVYTWGLYIDIHTYVNVLFIACSLWKLKRKQVLLPFLLDNSLPLCPLFLFYVKSAQFYCLLTLLKLNFYKYIYVYPCAISIFKWENIIFYIIYKY